MVHKYKKNINIDEVMGIWMVIMGCYMDDPLSSGVTPTQLMLQGNMANLKITCKNMLVRSIWHRLNRKSRDRYQ